MKRRSQTEVAETAVEEAARLLPPEPHTLASLESTLADIREHYRIAEDAKQRMVEAKERATECRKLYDAAVDSLLFAIQASEPQPAAPLPLFDARDALDETPSETLANA
jgi:hypothetical protein